MNRPTKTSTSTRRAAIASSLVASALVRSAGLGRSSFWYDEVVTVRLARTSGPSALWRQLAETDATRAPLHPLVLQGWVGLFGASEASCRALSVVAGVGTVALVARIAGRTSGRPWAGPWAAWLAAISPMLVVYAREARMYAWLVLATCLAWDALLAARTSGRPRLALARYAVAAGLLGYWHPLGLLMLATLGLASLLNRGWLGLSGRAWLGAHLVALAIVAPWIGSYLDHPPEWLVGRPTLRLLLGLPIGFLGGNFATLVGPVGLIGLGALRLDRGRGRIGLDDGPAVATLGAWLVVPPLLLFGYATVASPIFGPARYTLFVAPAYLILVARGLARLPGPVAAAAGLIVTGLAAADLSGLAFRADRTADWRAAAGALGRLDPSGAEPVALVTPDAVSDRTGVEAARYYLGPRRPVVAASGLPGAPRSATGRSWLAIPTRGGRAVAEAPAWAAVDGPSIDLDGLRLVPIRAGPG